MRKSIKTIATVMTLLVGFTLQSCSENFTGAEMVKIPNKNYMIAKTEVTQELYESVMGVNPSYLQIGSKKYEDQNENPYEVPVGENVKKLPVENLTWYDEVMFCNKLSEKEGLKSAYNIRIIETEIDEYTNVPYIWEAEVEWDESANGYRLPTEEEWEYAARGGEDYSYSGSDELESVGWYSRNSDKKTHEVAKKKPNGYGLYDMSGNVKEWCWDSCSIYYAADARYCRGGSYNSGDVECEVSYSGRNHFGIANSHVGFRLARSK